MQSYHNTLVAWTLVILFEEDFQIFTNKKFKKQNFMKENKEYFEIFKKYFSF